MLFFMRSSCLLLLVAHTHAAPLDPQIEQRELHNEATVHHRFAAWAASHGWVKHEEPALLWEHKLAQAKIAPAPGTSQQDLEPAGRFQNARALHAASVTPFSLTASK